MQYLVLYTGRELGSEFEVTDHFTAALFKYLGYSCLRRTVSGRDAAYLFECPRFDGELVLDEFADRETTVFLKDFVEAQKAVQEFRARAHKQFGVWTSHEYAKRGA